MRIGDVGNCRVPYHMIFNIVMKKILKTRYIPHSLAAFTLLSIILIVALPPEQTLGHIIKIVFVHGALVQTGLFTFAAAGILGAASLVTRRETLYPWCSAAQKSGVIVWSVYIVSSVVVTYLAWGIPVAWNEPRVRISAIIWGAALAFWVLVRLAQYQVFTALLNVVLAIAAWGLVKSVGILRHPFDPIGRSHSLVFKIAYAALGVIMLLMAIQITRWLRSSSRRQSVTDA